MQFWTSLAQGFAGRKPGDPPLTHAVIVHAYHPESFADLRAALACFRPETARFVSYPAGSDQHSEALMRAQFPGATLVAVENLGQDIGAFLQVLRQIDLGRFDLLCKLHSKGGDKLPSLWRGALLRGTAGTPERVAAFLHAFQTEPDLLLGGPRELYLHGPSHLMDNTAALRALADSDLTQPDWGFFAGTCFWLRRSLARAVLSAVGPDAFRREAAAPADTIPRDGRLAHALERFFGLQTARMGGKVALAPASDASAPITCLHGFPNDMPRAARPMMERLTTLHDSRIRAALSAQLEGRAPGLGFTRPPPRSTRNTGDYAILTPTGDRASAFARCAAMVAAQSLQPRQWVVVDDGRVPLPEQMPLPEGITYVRRTPHPEDPPHTLSSNLLAGLDHITQDRVLLFEDDDWYAPQYAEYLVPFLDNFQLVGLQNIRYYHLRGSAWKHGHQPAHTALAQSAFCRGHAWAHLEAVCRSGFPFIRERGLVDRHWWQTFEGTKRLIDGHPGLHLGFKGGLGADRRGLASGHDRSEPDYIPDPDGAYLRKAVGPDYAVYSRWRRPYRKPHVLYTACLGGTLPPPVPEALVGQFELYALTEAPLPENTQWQAIPLERPGAQGLRWAQLMPHLFFPDHDWSLWLDPSVVPRADPGQMVSAAIAAQSPMAGFRAAAGGIDPRILLRHHHAPEIAREMCRWWEQPPDPAPLAPAPEVPWHALTELSNLFQPAAAGLVDASLSG